METLYTNGPAAGGGVTKVVRPVLAIDSTVLPRHLARPVGSLPGGDPVKLRDIAHSRTGDKGNIANVSVIAFDERDYDRLVESVTAERVKALFVGIVEGDVVRYEMPAVGALNFVMHRALGGGVTRSLALDAHGKCLSSALLDLEI